MSKASSTSGLKNFGNVVKLGGVAFRLAPPNGELLAFFVISLFSIITQLPLPHAETNNR